MNKYSFYVANTKSLYFKSPCAQGYYAKATNEMRKNPFSNYWYGVFEANSFEEAKEMAMSSMVSQGCPKYTEEDEQRDVEYSLYYSTLSAKDFIK